MDCRDETLRDRLIANLDELLQVSGGRTTRLRLSAKDHPTFAAVERALTRLAETNVAIHVTGGPAWFDTKRWGAFNIRRDAVAHEVRTSLLLWLDEDSIADLARVAIDLWAWRTSVITFTTAPQRLTMREPDIRAIDDRTRDERATRIEFLHQTLLEPDIPEDVRLGFALEMGDLAASLGRVAEAESAYRAAVAAATDERSRAVTMGRIADILQARGALDEALRIRREEELPVYERLGDVRSRAVTMGKIADILQARGALDEALRIRREEELPVYRAPRRRARARGDDGPDRRHPAGPRRARRGPAHPPRGGAAGLRAPRRRARARGDDGQDRRHPAGPRRRSTRPCASAARRSCRSTSASATSARARSPWARSPTSCRPAASSTRPCASAARRSCRSTSASATCARARSPWARSPTSCRPAATLDEALRIRREEELPVYERLGDVRSRAVTMGQIADILQARGDARRGPAHPPRGAAAGLRAPRRRALARGDDGQDRRHPAGPRRARRGPAHPPRGGAAGL